MNIPQIIHNGVRIDKIISNVGHPAGKLLEPIPPEERWKYVHFLAIHLGTLACILGNDTAHQFYDPRRQLPGGESTPTIFLSDYFDAHGWANDSVNGRSPSDHMMVPFPDSYKTEFTEISQNFYDPRYRLPTMVAAIDPSAEGWQEGENKRILPFAEMDPYSCQLISNIFEVELTI